MQSVGLKQRWHQYGFGIEEGWEAPAEKVKPLCDAMGKCAAARLGPSESSCLRVQLQRGGITHLRLNKDGKPIANKYREGKMKRTLKREFKELEAVEMDAVGHKYQK
eukprot:TRINITY_DN2580_c0_g1_i3.p3 TRINITY_DN2580_c0_g1~~TRINITY_DN2580_c0_g1_i3.p3  ORF type:complete len:107 (-),score=5.82 TRINITY_DN2580_c0_g1_i3:566-886(-)